MEENRATQIIFEFDLDSKKLVAFSNQEFFLGNSSCHIFKS